MLPKERIKKANQIYENLLKYKLEKEHVGKIVRIENFRKDFFLGNNEIEASEKGGKKNPGKTFGFKRVGHRATHFVGLDIARYHYRIIIISNSQEIFNIKIIYDRYW